MRMLSRNKIKSPEEQKSGEGGDDKQVIKLMWPNREEEEESSDLPACRISETVSSLVLKLGLHIVVGSSRLDNHSQ